METRERRKILKSLGVPLPSYRIRSMNIDERKNEKRKMLRRLQSIISLATTVDWYDQSIYDTPVIDTGECDYPGSSYLSCAVYEFQRGNLQHISFVSHSIRFPTSSLSHILLLYADYYNSSPALSSLSVTFRGPNPPCSVPYMLSMSPRCFNRDPEPS